jgi:hypothetical protein
MKKIILLSSVVLLAALFITSCTRRVDRNTDENYWLTKERADVVYSDSYCGYYVVETAYGYTVLHNTAGTRPYEGDIMYGYFGSYGVKDFYNYSAGAIIRAEVIEYDLSYVDAQYAVDYYCPNSRIAGKKIKTSATMQNKVKRVVVEAEAGKQ